MDSTYVSERIWGAKGYLKTLFLFLKYVIIVAACIAFILRIYIYLFNFVRKINTHTGPLDGRAKFSFGVSQVKETGSDF